MVAVLLVFCLAFSNPRVVSTLDIPDTADIEVLILVTNGFGWNYFDAKDCLELWGVNVTTVAYALDYEIDSCLNREPRPITADLLMSEMTTEMVQEFDCLLVTSGGHWASLIADNTVLNFISDAYDLGLVVASICTGTRVVAEANGIVNGCKVIEFSLSMGQMALAGATTVYGIEAITDGQIITGGRGGGTGGGGWLEAPTSEVCAEIVRQVLGLSRVTNSSITPARGPSGTTFTIVADTSNLNESLGEILSTDIEEVTAQIYVLGNRTLIDTIELTNPDQNGNYTGYFVGLEDGDYIVDIEIEDSNSTLEVVRELETFSVGIEPTQPIDVVLISTVTGGSIIIIILVVALTRKK
ncbi:MAG: DJ-1/PfpI family protein [Candidatus Thorarchaeota archaeon SMTZ1-45]|nr:MAG: hypothetical protein AM325_11625 [Candidatus Thorarchaeota archaeon SMTZ1-45]